MAGILDYLDWRGDLTFSQDPFNEVDNLILSELSYLDYSEVLPAEEDGGAPMRDITIADVRAALDGSYGQEWPPIGALFSPEYSQLLIKAAESKRFGSLRLSDYINHIDEEVQEQFSAVTFTFEDGSKYIAFRGTDDTLIGWKENFNMSFQNAVPAQTDAAAYLERAAGVSAGALLTGGHSKGGNLAVYAAANVSRETQDRIAHVYNNDGPGFGNALLSRSEYLLVRDRVHTILPQSSIVGMLLEHEENYEVVKSNLPALLQHNGFSWEVKGNCFEHMETVTEETRILNQTLSAWVGGMDKEQRELFVEAFFSILAATKAKSLSDFTKNRLEKAVSVMLKMRDLDKDTQNVLNITLQALFVESRNAISQTLTDLGRKSREIPVKDDSKMRIKILSDSTCDLSPELIEEYGIGILPLHVMKGGVSYKDGVDITPADIFRHVDDGGTLCTTSAISVGEYTEYFSQCADKHDAVICVCIGSQFSSCYQNACIAAQDFGNVHVVDSRNLSSGQGHVVVEAAKAADTMSDAKEICDFLNALTPRVEASFLLDRLDYMRKGGRCSAIAVLGANVLKLKPCIEVVDGKMTVGKKYRGPFEKCIGEYVCDRLGGRNDIAYERIFITHPAASSQAVSAARKAIEQYASFDRTIETRAGCTVSCHCGPSTLGVLFIRK